MQREWFGVLAGVAVLLCNLGAAGWADAQTNVWTPVGPTGGMITGVGFDASVANLAYATTEGGGFFRSLDFGVSWKAANAGLSDGHLQSLATSGATIFVGGDNGVSRSGDRGRSFERLPGAPILVSALGVGTGARPAIYAAGIFAGAWRSDDGGNTWVEIDEGLEKDQTMPAAVINAFLVDPRRPDLVWAGSENGVYRSLDAGAHWTRTTSGLACLVTSLAIDSANTLYAGCYVDPLLTTPVPPALFVSFDLGLTWHAAVRGLAARGVTSLLADSSGTVWAGTQNAGVFRTADGGRRWSAAGTGTQGQSIGALARSPHRPSLLLAGSGHFLNATLPQEGPGVFRTTSSGALWTLAGPGPDATSIVALVADPVTPGILSALDVTAGVFRSLSGGALWQPLNGGLPVPAGSGLLDLAGDTAVSRRLYLAGQVNGENVLYQDHSAALPWQRLSHVPAGCSSPLTAGADGKLFLGAFGGQGGSVCASADGGTTWTMGAVGFIFVTSIAVAPSEPARVYAAGILASHAPPTPTFFRSDDGGVTWSGVSSLSPTGEHALAVDPQDADLVYAATGGVQRSRDGGATWETLLTGDATAVWVGLRSSSILFAARTFSSGSAVALQSPAISVSDDGGATWSPLSAGLPPNVGVSGLAFDAFNPSLVYAATAGGGIFSLEHPD
jgi:hypothetical protein